MDNDLLMWGLVALCAMFVQGVVGMFIGRTKGRENAGFLYGLFLGVIGWLLVGLGPDMRPQAARQNAGGGRWITPQVSTQAARPAAEGHNTLLPVLTLIVGVVLGVVLKTVLDAGAVRPALPNWRATESAMEYRVTGRATRSAMLTYTLPNGGMEQETVSLPWSRQFTARTGDRAIISAQNAEEGGQLTTAILINGVEVATNTARGGYTITTSQAEAP